VKRSIGEWERGRGGERVKGRNRKASVSENITMVSAINCILMVIRSIFVVIYCYSKAFYSQRGAHFITDLAFNFSEAFYYRGDIQSQPAVHLFSVSPFLRFALTWGSGVR
jgi:hypothetical protein